MLLILLHAKAILENVAASIEIIAIPHAGLLESRTKKAGVCWREWNSRIAGRIN